MAEAVTTEEMRDSLNQLWGEELYRLYQRELSGEFGRSQRINGEWISRQDATFEELQNEINERYNKLTLTLV